MAFRWAVINGNWSDAATWNNGGVLGLPTGSDVVSPNQLRVTIDTDITVTQLTSARSGSINIQGGGVFVLNNGVTITAYGTGSLPGIWPYAPQASGSLLLISQSNSAVISSSMRMPGIYLNSTGGFGNMLLMTGSSNVTISGSVSGVAYAASNGWGVIHSSTGTLRIFGTVEGAPGLGGVNGANGITTTSTGTTNITGDVYHHNFTANAANNPINMQGGAIHTLIITGSVYQGDGAQVTILNTSGNSNIFISGSLIGRTSSAVGTIQKGTTGDITIIGDIIGQIAGGNSISHNSTGNIIVSGSIIKRGAGIPISTTGASTTIVTGSISFTGSISGPVISSTSTSGLVRIASPATSFNTFNPIYSPRIQYFSDSTPTYTFQSDTFGKDVTFYDVAFTSSLPTQTNVRSGSLYGGTNQFSGSMVVPSTGSVRYGVPVDNTTGSATLTPQDILDYAVSSLTGSNSIGARLQNIATVQTTAATIAAFKGK
jgi:hypothetical protein